MQTTTELRDAFRFHLQTTGARPADKMRAVECIERARADIAAGKSRHPAPVKPYAAVSWKADNRPRSRERIGYVQDVDGAGLRLVGEVNADSRRGDVWNTSSDKSGWYTDPYGDVFRDGTGLCWGVVYQLPARDGKARFVAGYEFGGVDGGPTVDFGTVYESDWSGDYWNNNARELDAAIDAARAADSLAESAAEQEREYQTAWQAGSRYADKGAEVAAERKSVLALLAERRQAKADGVRYPAICVALAGRIEDALERIREVRAEREQLASGDYDSLIFYPSAELRSAFNEGAGETVLA